MPTSYNFKHSFALCPYVSLVLVLILWSWGFGPGPGARRSTLLCSIFLEHILSGICFAFALLVLNLTFQSVMRRLAVLVLLASFTYATLAQICPLQEHVVCNDSELKHQCVCAMTMEEVGRDLSLFTRRLRIFETMV